MADGQNQVDPMVIQESVQWEGGPLDLFFGSDKRDAFDGRGQGTAIRGNGLVRVPCSGTTGLRMAR